VGEIPSAVPANFLPSSRENPSSGVEFAFISKWRKSHQRRDEFGWDSEWENSISSTSKLYEVAPMFSLLSSRLLIILFQDEA